LALDSLYSLTFEEFSNAVAGKREVHEIQERSNWERTRWQTALLLNVHTKKGQKIKPRDLVVFEWEKKREAARPKIDGFNVLRSLSKKN
tara:strand:+ start:988 stop:1254 length:267 start_codon:yes stop_codon:yes gene_type:complete